MMLRKWMAFALAWVVILGGALLAHAVQTADGTTVTEVRIAAEPGVTVSGLLYTPRGATAATPAPAILVSHGYINTREMQSPFAIELSRRGYVVLAITGPPPIEWPSSPIAVLSTIGRDFR